MGTVQGILRELEDIRLSTSTLSSILSANEPLLQWYARLRAIYYLSVKLICYSNYLVLTAPRGTSCSGTLMLHLIDFVAPVMLR